MNRNDERAETAEGLGPDLILDNRNVPLTRKGAPLNLNVAVHF